MTTKNIELNTKQQAITAVLRRRGKNSYGLISNEDLLGVTPQDELQQAGMGNKAGQMRNAINDILASEYGIGLVPDGHDGNHLIVPLDQRAGYMMISRMRKLVRLITDHGGLPGHLKATVLQFQDNPYLGQEMIGFFKVAERTFRAVEIVALEVIVPKLNRLEGMMVKYVPGMEDDEEDVA